MNLKKIKSIISVACTILVLIAFILMLTTNGSKASQTTSGITAIAIFSGTLSIFGGNGKVIIKGFGLVLESQYYDYAGANASPSPVGILLFIGVIALLGGLFYLAYSYYKEKENNLINYILLGIGVVDCILFIVNPYVFKALNVAYVGEESKMSLCGGWIAALIIILLSSAIAFALAFFNKSIPLFANMKNTESKSEKSMSESEKVELLTKYKSLLDSGAISQEEFEEKKKSLL